MLIISWIFALALGLLACAPPLNYGVPIIVNSFWWLYLIVVSCFASFVLISRPMHPALKVLTVYLFVTCFYSMAPVGSFNAFVIFTLTLAYFLAAKHFDYGPFLTVIQCAFWFQFLFATVSLLGKDELMMFGSHDKVFFGTILQHMRFASLMAIMSPFLVLRSKWYLVPICIAAILCHSSGFALAIAAGVVVYFLLKKKRGLWNWKTGVGCLALFSAVGAAIWAGRDSWLVALREGRVPIWGLILKSWLYDTKAGRGEPDAWGLSQTGPLDLPHFFWGHGADSFRPLFAAYKQDANAWAESHNCWIQMPWEIGLTGFLIVLVYLGWLVKRLYDAQEHELLAGGAAIATNMIFHFPTRMTQTIWLIVTYLALCEQRLFRKGYRHPDILGCAVSIYRRAFSTRGTGPGSRTRSKGRMPRFSWPW